MLRRFVWTRTPDSEWSYSIFHWIKLYLVEPLQARFKQSTESLVCTDETILWTPTERRFNKYQREA